MPNGLDLTRQRVNRRVQISKNPVTDGEILPDRAEKVSSVTWAAGDDTLFYVTEDPAKRAYRLWRHRLGAAADDLLYEETDEVFRLYVWRTRSRAFSRIRATSSA